MKRVFGSVAFRISALVLSVLLQIGVYVMLFLFLSEYGNLFLVFCTVLSVLAVFRIVLKNTPPEYKIAWIIPILVFPIFGGALYLIFGHSVLSKRERRRISAISSQYGAAAAHVSSALPSLEEVSRTAAFQSRYLERCSYAPCLDGTSVRYFPVGEDMHAALLADLEKAQRFIFLEYFIIGEGEMWSSVLEILERKAKAGVDVRLMYDDLGCLFLLPGDFPSQMEAKGIRCCVFNRFRHIFNSRFNNRDHRKICVIDGNVGYTGGINLSDEYINRVERFGHWKDTAVRLQGRGVGTLTGIFLSAWDFYRECVTDLASYLPAETVDAPGFVQPFSTSPGGEPVGVNMYMNAISKARSYIYLTTPYLIIDSTVISALTLAAKSGIDVRIITPGIPDKKTVFFLTRSYYRVLVQAGVRIFEYIPGFIHAKEFVADDVTAMVGTINLDYRSLYLHHECGVWMHGTDCISAIKEDFLNTQAQCREITADAIREMPLSQRFFLAFLRIFAPLL